MPVLMNFQRHLSGMLGCLSVKAGLFVKKIRNIDLTEDNENGLDTPEVTFVDGSREK